MNPEQRMVDEFHKTFDLPRPGTPTFEHITEVRWRLIAEELEELRQAELAGDMIEAIDALVDLQYVVAGYAVALGVDLEPFFQAVHVNNMSKVCEDCGQPHYREDGKVIKPESYVPVNLHPIYSLLYGALPTQEEGI